MRELIADLFISLDGFASGVNEAAFFGCFRAALAPQNGLDLAAEFPTVKRSVAVKAVP
jgi:hypothetical protein